MSIAIRKWGNSQGIIIPTTFLKQLGVETGQKLDIKIENGNLVLSPKKKKHIFSESYLLKDTGSYQAHSDELAQVNGMEIGNE